MDPADNDLDAARLLKDFHHVLRSDPDLGRVFTRQALELWLQGHCNHYQRYPALHGKVARLAQRLPEVYRRSLECTLLCLMIARQMRLPEQTVQVLFLAALTHDLGMLHIDPGLVTRQGKLTPEEWRKVQAHVVIGQKFLLSIPGMPPDVARAVLEHHERPDGTGYPSGCKGESLSQSGQMVALADSVVAVYHNRLLPRGGTLRDIVPMLQMNSQDYFYTNYAALITLLRQAELSRSGRIHREQLVLFIDQLLADMAQVSKCLTLLAPPLQEASACEDVSLRNLRQLHSHIAVGLRGSGLLDEAFRRWVEHVREQRLVDALGEVEDAHLMLEELAFHLLRLCRMIALYDAGATPGIRQLQARLEPWWGILARIGGDAPCAESSAAQPAGRTMQP